MEEKKYSEQEVRKIIHEEVNNAVKNKSYSYGKWAVDHFVAGILGVVFIIIVIAILAFINPS